MSEQIRKNSKDSEKILKLLCDNSPQEYEDYNFDAEILNSKIKSSNTYNIAVVGNYGSGKSSVIETYLNKYRKNDYNRSYVRITLASFNYESEDKDSHKYTEAQIEKSILQQLLYSRTKYDLPNSNVNRINKTLLSHTAAIAGVIALFLFTLITLYLSVSNIYVLIPQKYNSYLCIICATCGFILLGWIIHYKKIKKIEFKDISIESDSKSSEDIINKFVDEILYFFDCTNVNLVLFEDLDRLDKKHIFTKLRELNAIINNRDIKTRKVTFLYAVKNDLLKTEEERSKFFEFILPIIPNTNPITIAKQMQDKIDQITEIIPEIKIDSQIIMDTSECIPNRRVLNSVFNDFVLMYNKIFCDKDTDISNLSQEQLFSWCLYKNIYPEDYTFLEKNRGLVPIILNMEELRNIAKEKIENEINILKKEQENIKNETLKNIDELKDILISNILKINPNRSNYYERYIKSINDITSFNDIFTTLSRQPGLENIKSEIDVNKYLGREKSISNNNTSYTQNIEEKIRENKIKLINIERANSKVIMQKMGIDSFFSANRDIKKKYKDELQSNEIDDIELDNQIKFIRILIYKEYIDDTYLNYTSNSKTNLISLNDRQFILSIKSGEQNFNIKLDNIKNTLSLINDKDFNNIIILNADLLSNLETIEKISTHKYKNLKILLSGDSEDLFKNIKDFIQSIESNDVIKRFLDKFVDINPKMSIKLISCADIEIQSYILNKFIKDDNLKNNLKLLIKEELSKIKKYKQIFDGSTTEEVINFLNEISPKFQTLDEAYESTDEIQKYIISKNMYEISTNNIRIALGVYNDESFKSKNYYCILNGPEYVKKYINENIQTYLSAILFDSEINENEEPEENILSLLNNEKIGIDKKIKFIEKYKFNINNLDTCPINLFEKIIENNRIVKSWINLLIIYQKNNNNIDIAMKIISKDLLDDNIPNDNSVKKQFIDKYMQRNNNEDEIKIISEKISNHIPMNLDSISKYKDANLKPLFDMKKIDIQQPIAYINLKDKPRSLASYTKNYLINDDEIMKFFKGINKISTINIFDNDEIDKSVKKIILTTNNIAFTTDEKKKYESILQ